MKVILGFVAGIVAGIVSTYLFISLGTFNSMPSDREYPAFELPIYLDFIGVMMATVTAVLTAVAIGIALVAIFTFREIKQIVVAEANKTLTKIDRNIDKEYMRGIFEKMIFEGVELEPQRADDEKNISMKNSDEN